MRKILVLDDQPDSLTTLQAILEYRGYSDVIAASDPAKAIGICDGRCGIDLFLCDIILRAPITGAQAAFEILGRCPDLPILFTSGTALEGIDDADFETLNRLLPARVDFLQKPFTASQLISAVSRLLEAPEVPPDFVRAMKRAAENRHSARNQRPRTFRAGS